MNALYKSERKKINRETFLNAEPIITITLLLKIEDDVIIKAVDW